MKYSPETHDFVPCGYNVAVQIEKVEEVSAGGIVLATNTEKKREQGGHDIGVASAFGPTVYLAYEGCDAETAEERAEKWGFKLGDTVVMERYQGKLLNCAGFENYRVITDNQIMGKFVEKESSDA